MKLSEGVEWGVHCCVVLTVADGPTSAGRLAELHGVSRTYLAKTLQCLSRAGLVRSVEGRNGGYELTRGAETINLLDVIQAIEGIDPAFRCTEIRQRGPLAATAEDCVKPCGVARAMAQAETAWRASLASVSIADLAAGLDRETSGAAFDALRGWLAQ